MLLNFKEKIDFFLSREPILYCVIIESKWPHCENHANATIYAASIACNLHYHHLLKMMLPATYVFVLTMFKLLGHNMDGFPNAV
jgi:hypothetical protein